ncbi:unnamed protein product [Adineta ricciae]|uniref:Rootletin-like coiled-coil domain-containing protein n=1 Tax=Adineta ricciae TaxID=249248 RepID=A0A814GKI2_ADIRI|nr:unnamed protein product [Adineta ricciae]
MGDDIPLENSFHLEEVLSDEDENRSTTIRGRTQDIFVNRIRTPPITRSRSQHTVSSQSSVRNLMGTSSAVQLLDENRFLNDELNRVETVLNLTRAEKDELSIRYNALSDRLEQSLRAHGIDVASEAGDGEPERRVLVQQNIELRRRLEEEHQSYKRKLSNYQEGQQKQAQLVQKLQEKVVQYKKRCAELESLTDQQRVDMDRIRVSSTSNSTPPSLTYKSRIPENSEEQDASAIILEEEKQKSANLGQLNILLREQLDQAHLANRQLSDDVRHLTKELQQVREELAKRKHDFKEETRAFNKYYDKEHNMMYELWREIVSFRQQFTELKGTTERDLTRVRNDLAQTGRSLTSACFSFLTSAKTAESQGQAAAERERNDRANLESQIREKTREMTDLQQKLQELTQLNEKLRNQLSDKDSAITNLARTNQAMVSFSFSSNN